MNEWKTKLSRCKHRYVWISAYSWLQKKFLRFKNVLLCKENYSISADNLLKQDWNHLFVTLQLLKNPNFNQQIKEKTAADCFCYIIASTWGHIFKNHVKRHDTGRILHHVHIRIRGDKFLLRLCRPHFGSLEVHNSWKTNKNKGWKTTEVHQTASEQTSRLQKQQYLKIWEKKRTQVKKKLKKTLSSTEVEGWWWGFVLQPQNQELP